MVVTSNHQGVTMTTGSNWSRTSSVVASDILDLLDELEQAAADDTGIATSQLRSFHRGLITALQRARTRRVEMAEVAV